MLHAARTPAGGDPGDEPATLAAVSGVGVTRRLPNRWFSRRRVVQNGLVSDPLNRLTGLYRTSGDYLEPKLKTPSTVWESGARAEKRLPVDRST